MRVIYPGFDFYIVVEMLPMKDYNIEENSFDYEYGSQRGMHVGKPSVIDYSWRIVGYDSEILMFHSLEHVSSVINDDGEFFKKYEDKLIEEYIKEIR